jgi:hypothetical protein
VVVAVMAVVGALVIALTPPPRQNAGPRPAGLGP